MKSPSPMVTWIILEPTTPIVNCFVSLITAHTMSTSGFDLKGVIELPNHKELGRGAYGRVYAVKCCQIICAAKEIHSILEARENAMHHRFIY